MSCLWEPESTAYSIRVEEALPPAPPSPDPWPRASLSLAGRGLRDHCSTLLFYRGQNPRHKKRWDLLELVTALDWNLCLELVRPEQLALGTLPLHVPVDLPFWRQSLLSTGEPGVLVILLDGAKLNSSAQTPGQVPALFQKLSHLPLPLFLF
jgi:hypothetical protein